MFESMQIGVWRTITFFDKEVNSTSAAVIKYMMVYLNSTNQPVRVYAF